MAGKGAKTEITFTKTQAKMLAILGDGGWHTPKELHGCLPDELGPISNVQMHISYMREKLRPEKIIVAQRVDGRTFYRLMDVPQVQSFSS